MVRRVSAGGGQSESFQMPPSTRMPRVRSCAAQSATSARVVTIPRATRSAPSTEARTAGASTAAPSPSSKATPSTQTYPLALSERGCGGPKGRTSNGSSVTALACRWTQRAKWDLPSPVRAETKRMRLALAACAASNARATRRCSARSNSGDLLTPSFVSKIGSEGKIRLERTENG